MKAFVVFLFATIRRMQVLPGLPAKAWYVIWGATMLVFACNVFELFGLAWKDEITLACPFVFLLLFFTPIELRRDLWCVRPAGSADENAWRVIPRSLSKIALEDRRVEVQLVTVINGEIKHEQRFIPGGGRT